MVMIRAILRPTKMSEVLQALAQAGYTAATHMDVYGRGKQKGIQVGDVFYDELPKDMLLMVVGDEDKKAVIDIIMKHARTGEHGNFGDGRIFVSPVLEAYTISTREKGL